jgi:hypothetical protein
MSDIPIQAEQHWRRVGPQRLDACGDPDYVVVARGTSCLSKVGKASWP